MFDIHPHLFKFAKLFKFYFLNIGTFTNVL